MRSLVAAAQRPGRVSAMGAVKEAALAYAHADDADDAEFRRAEKRLEQAVYHVHHRLTVRTYCACGCGTWWYPEARAGRPRVFLNSDHRAFAEAKRKRDARAGGVDLPQTPPRRAAARRKGRA